MNLYLDILDKGPVNNIKFAVHVGTPIEKGMAVKIIKFAVKFLIFQPTCTPIFISKNSPERLTLPR